MADFPGIAGGVPVVVWETVGSTNQEGLALVTAGERRPTWIVARRQSAGRGRRGRVWISEPGNLYASLLLFDAAPPAVVSGICFVAALALHDALLNAAPGLTTERLKLKWPNDLLLGGKKLAGILVEGRALEQCRTATVVGFGVNCAHHPEGTELGATDLAAAGSPLAPDALLPALGEAMAARLREWERGGNFSAIRAAWLACAEGVGGAVEVRLADRTISGTFDAIDAAGALVIRRGDGARETIAAGEVFPLAAG